MNIQEKEVSDYIDGEKVREPYPFPDEGECTKCGNKVLERAWDQIRCWKCGTYWFDDWLYDE